MTEYSPDLGGVLALVIQFILPLVVGLVTKVSTASSVKSVLLLALTALTQFVLSWQEAVEAAQTFDYGLVLWNVAVGFAISTAAHFGLYRGTGLTAKAQQTLVRD